MSLAQELSAAPNKQSTQNTRSFLRIAFTGSDTEVFRYRANEAARLPGGSTPTDVQRTVWSNSPQKFRNVSYVDCELIKLN